MRIRDWSSDVCSSDLTLAQIREQMSLAVDRVMTEGSLYDPELAALAIKQARGDLVEAIFLLRAYRTTLPRFGAGEPLDTSRSEERRVGNAGVSPCQSRWWPEHKKKKKNTIQTN